MSFTTLKGIENVGQSSLSEIIRDNVIVFLEWGLLNVGNFFNITIPTSGSYGGRREILRPVDDPRFDSGKVWEAYRGNWVWQSGLSTSEQPIAISGVFVDNTFIPASGFTINYPEGKIIFNTAQSTSSTVKMEYSHGWVQVRASKDIPFFQEGHTRSFRVDDSSFLAGSGIWDQLRQTRVELPVIAVETLKDREYQGYQLGGGSWVRTNILFHIISEDDSISYRLADTLAHQSEKTIYLFDTNMMARQNRFPLQYDGSKSSNPLTYPDLVAATGDGGFRYTKDVTNGQIRIFDTSAGSSEKISPRLYHSTARWRTEVIMQKI